jgi:hypothetical protein
MVRPPADIAPVRRQRVTRHIRVRIGSRRCMSESLEGSSMRGASNMSRGM